ncbi:hypothetical protein BS47DRAFT_1368903 [Hydnum rufescens UP504]|uniref:Uncharacterized protein n=1 Tax=Hydnum rufescens UP504 TaxID=1448309 RepID=A0A9P6AEU4_9AGAM|nr:hypothetical protein BS47DRAFT_1368903 [Hydnum rufescens UP504]
MGNSKTYKKPRGPGSNKSQHTADSSEQLPLPPRVNHAIVELELRSRPRQAAFKVYWPPHGAKHLDEVTQQGTKSQASHHPSPLVPIPLLSCASSPPPPMFSHALTQTKSPSPIIATSSSLAHFPMVDDRALEDEINAPEHPLFLSDDGYKSDSDDPVADQDYADDLVDASAADQEDINNLINGDNDDNDDDLDEEVVSSMMTGGHFTQEQVLEVKGLANDLMVGLRHRVKAWEHPLDAVMWIANLVIATKEQRAGGNAWNAYQNAFPEDPEKATSELGSQMKSLNKRWSDNVKWGAKLNMHIMYIIISGNPNVAASKHSTMSLIFWWFKPFHSERWVCSIEQGGTLGDPNPDDGADGTTRPNPKRRRTNEVADGSGTRRGAKRKKVVSNPIIEDEDEGPQATSTHSIGPALSSTSTPPSPLPVFGVGTMGPQWLMLT